MEIRLGKLQTQVNRVNKAFTVYYKVDGELKDAQDISNPSIVIDISDTSNIKDEIGTTSKNSQFRAEFYNISYAYIPDLKRYYFVRKITVVRKNIVQYDLHVDVLQFYDFIKLQKVYVSRNENDYDLKLPDERRIIKNVKTQTIFEPTTVSTGSLVNTTFSTRQDFITDRNIVVNAIKDADSYEQYDSVPITGSGGTNLTNINRLYGSFLSTLPRRHYVITGRELAGLLVALKNDNNLASFIGGIYAYPFKPYVRSTQGGVTLTTPFIVNTTRIKHWQTLPEETVVDSDVGQGEAHSQELIIAHFKLTSSTYAPDFNYLEPYASYEIYIPFYGWKEIQVNALLEHELVVFYKVDYINNSATVFLYDNTQQNILFSAPCTLGVEIPLSTTNAKEVQDRRTTNAISSVLQLVGSGLAIGGALIKGGAMLPVAVGQGILSGTKAIGSGITNEVTNYERGQIQTASNSNALITPLKVFIRRNVSQVQYSNDADFRAQNGGICNKEKFLSACTGYTEVADIPYYRYGAMLSSMTYPTKSEEEEITTLLKKGVIFPST